MGGISTLVASHLYIGIMNGYTNPFLHGCSLAWSNAISVAAPWSVTSNKFLARGRRSVLTLRVVFEMLERPLLTIDTQTAPAPHTVRNCTSDLSDLYWVDMPHIPTSTQPQP